MDKSYNNIEFRNYILKLNEYNDITSNVWFNCNNIEYRSELIIENEFKDFLDIKNLIQEFKNLKI